MDKALIDSFIIRFTDIGLKLLGALAIWIGGRWFIKFALNLIVNRLERQRIDQTIVAYARNTTSVVLNIALVVVLMGMLGIETTSFAAFVAGAGLAIGAAWGGLLANFAAGAFLVILRPFKVGDHISAGGATGIVTEVGLFVTTMNSLDNVRTFVGNSKLLASNVRNFSANEWRRVDLSGALHRSGDLDKTIAEIRERLLRVPNVLAEPAPEVKVLSFDHQCLHLAIRPYSHNDNYWQVHSDATAALRELLVEGGAHASGIDHSGEGEGAEGEKGAAEEEKE